MESPTPYPVNLSIDYPDRELNRLTTFFRIFMVIPIWIILILLLGITSTDNRLAAAGGLVVLPTLLMLLFRRKYPRWWYDWNVALTKFWYRVGAYGSVLRDEYPSTDEEQAVHIDIPYPNAQQDLNRWLPLIKWFLAIPHYIVIVFLALGAIVAVIIAWFAILFTGRYPRSLFDYVVGVSRWCLRVSAYAFLLTTDLYPPFRLSP